MRSGCLVTSRQIYDENRRWPLVEEIILEVPLALEERGREMDLEK